MRSAIFNSLHGMAQFRYKDRRCHSLIYSRSDVLFVSSAYNPEEWAKAGNPVIAPWVLAEWSE